MKANWKAIGITAVTAAILYYPALKLYQHLTKGNPERDDNKKDDHHVVKAFSPAYRGKYKPHHRHTHDGLDGHDHV